MNEQSNEERAIQTTSAIVAFTFVVLIVDKVFNLDLPTLVILAPILGRVVFLLITSEDRKEQ